ncbi:MAG: hypothetical protein OEM63_05055 [Gammaproteobacteria bacterium]|nr:hypothetical protein [Gammaproteobacteria bacterium]
MSLFGVLWGWFLLACPLVFIAGLVWINRAKKLDTPVDGVPSMRQWILVSAGSLGFLILMGFVFLAAALDHSSGSNPLSWLALPVILIGPVYYSVSAMRWFTGVRRGLREQQSDGDRVT